MHESLLQDKIQSLIEKYKNSPFLHNGRSLEGGIDCLGFIILFYKEFGIYIPNDDGEYIDEDWYKTDPNRYIRGIHRTGGVPVSIYQLKPLDLVYFAISHNIITHTGIMINGHEFLHMSPKTGFTISPMDRLWGRRFRGALRFL